MVRSSSNKEQPIWFEDLEEDELYSSCQSNINNQLIQKNNYLASTNLATNEKKYSNLKPKDFAELVFDFTNYDTS